MKQKLLITAVMAYCFLALAANIHAQDNALVINALNKKEDVKIDDIVNSATLRLHDGRKIRLIGLIPLEKPKRKEPIRNEYNIIIEKDDPIIPFEQTVYDFIVTLLKGKEVHLEFDTLYRDPDGYVLGYIFLKDGTFVNAEIIRQGFSDLHLTPQNTKYEKELRAAYLEAKKEKRGMQGN